MSREQRREWRSWRPAVVEEEPADSNHYYVIDGGGWLEKGGPWILKEVQLFGDAMEVQYAPLTADGESWIKFRDGTK